MQRRSLTSEERALLHKLASQIQAGLRGEGPQDLESALSPVEERALLILESDVDRGVLGRPWPRIESGWLFLFLGFSPRVSDVLRSTWGALSPTSSQAGRKTPEISARVELAMQFSEALQEGDLDAALRVVDTSTLSTLYAILPGGEARPRSGPIRLVVDPGGPTEADRRVILKIAKAIRSGTRKNLSIRDVLEKEDVVGLYRLAQALDDGAWGYRWARASGRAPWQVLGFPVAANGVLAVSQFRAHRPLGVEESRVHGLIGLASEFAAALEALDFAGAERTYREMDLPYPAWE